jgi:hypothetical protein
MDKRSNTWLVVDDNEYKTIESESKPKNVKIICKVGDAVWNFDHNFENNGKTHVAVVNCFTVVNVNESSEVFFHLNTPQGNNTIAKGEMCSPVFGFLNWLYKWYVNAQYSKNTHQFSL